MTIQLMATDAVPDKPFTDLRHTTQDIQSIRFMSTMIWQLLEAMMQSDVARPLLLHHPTKRAWTHRIVITQPERLRERDHLPIVGFFGFKTPQANVALAQELDEELIAELFDFDEILGYATIWLPTGDYANMVVFASPKGKEQYGHSKKHANAVRLLTPDYYHVIRIYNGELPNGIASPDTLRLDRIKYYDYSETPMWRAVRNMAT